MIEHYLTELTQAKRILLLQGPIGNFFTVLSAWLSRQHCTVFKINLNAGDEFFYPRHIENTHAYQGTLADFQAYLTAFCLDHHIESIVCFGDNRQYHRIAKALCEAKQMTFWAFEEGYFRPDYITLEKTGVNAHSPLPKNAAFFLPFADLPECEAPQKLAKGFCPMAKRAIQYYVSANFKSNAYPHYQHHRFLDLKYYLKLWITSGIKRLYYYLYDRHFVRRIEKGEFGEFFVLPLQVYDDSQIKVHSDFESVEAFLQTVLHSFATNAPRHLRLLVKHHPMDRGFIDYGKVIKAFIARFPHLKKRIYYIHDVPMPYFLRYGKGMVTLNSTSGISALLHNMPVKTLGRANYDFAGLTYQGCLNEFWQNPERPDEKVFHAFRQFHLHKTHLNGSFYNKVILPEK